MCNFLRLSTTEVLMGVCCKVALLMDGKTPLIPDWIGFDYTHLIVVTLATNQTTKQFTQRKL